MARAVSDHNSGRAQAIAPRFTAISAPNPQHVATTPNQPDGAARGCSSQGPAGPSSARVVVPFASAITHWYLAHGLGCYPSVTTVNSDGEEVYGDVRYIDSNTAVVDFTFPLAGNAYLN